MASQFRRATCPAGITLRSAEVGEDPRCYEASGVPLNLCIQVLFFLPCCVGVFFICVFLRTGGGVLAINGLNTPVKRQYFFLLGGSISTVPHQ